MQAPAGESSGEIFRDDDLLIVCNDVTLPERCILCGDPAKSRAIRLAFTWDTSFTVTHQSTLELREKAAIHAHLCARHYGRWYMGRMAGGAGAVAGFALIAAGMALAVISESSDVPAYTPLGIGLAIAGFAGAILSMFFFTLRTRTLTCTLIRGNYVYLDGASPDFLAAFPALPKAVPPPAVERVSKP